MGQIMFCNNCGASISEKDKFCPQCGKEHQISEPTSVAPLLRRAMIFLESDDWSKADDYCEQVLDLEPENAQAYLIKLMIRAQVKKEEDLACAKASFADWKSYQDVLRFGDDALRKRLEEYLQQTIANLRLQEEAAKRQELERQQAEKLQHKNSTYANARRYDHAQSSIYDLTKAIELYSQIPEHMDAWERRQSCKQRLEELEKQKALQFLQQQKERQRIHRIKAIVIAIALVALVCIIILVVCSVNASNIKKADNLSDELAGMSFECSYRKTSDSYYWGTENMLGNGSGTPRSFTDYEIVYYFQSSDSVVINTTSKYAKNPYTVKNGEIQYEHVDTDQQIASGYTVNISFWGKATVTINGEVYQLSIGYGGKPASISDGTHIFTCR